MSFNIIMVFLGLSMILSSTLIARVWAQRHSSGQSPNLIAALMLAVLWWTAWYALEIVTPVDSIKLLSNSLKFVGIVFVPVFWLLFGFQYTGRTEWLVRRRIALLCLVPCITLGLIATNTYHQLFWQDLGIINLGGYAVTSSTRGIWFWIHSIYSYILIMTASYVLFRQFSGSPDLYRRQLVALLIAVAAPMIANAITIFGNQQLDITPISFTITGLALTWGLLRFQLLNLVPIARNLVVESMSDGVIVLDARGRVVDLNPSARQLMTGINTDAIGQDIGMVIERLGTKLDLDHWNKTSGVVQDELLLGQGTQQRVLDVQVSPLFGQRHQLSGRVVMFRDVTDRKQTEQQIREQNEALRTANHELAEARKQAEHATHLKSQFLATMSHELRTPLNAVIGYTEIQLAGITGELSAKQRDFQERVLANALHLLGLINDILDLSRIEAGRMDLLLRPINLRMWLDEIVMQNRVLAEAKKLPVVVEIDPRLPELIIGDTDRLRQVVINLLSNAVKFTENGNLKIAVAENDKETWRIDVIDTGIGIPIHAQETIFEEFRQVDGTSRRQYGGTGLGLAIVRKLVVMMGGHIRLKSEVGKGSTFTIILPHIVETEKLVTHLGKVAIEVQTI